jgi:hypothetical protein
MAQTLPKHSQTSPKHHPNIAQTLPKHCPNIAQTCSVHAYIMPRSCLYHAHIMLISCLYDAYIMPIACTYHRYILTISCLYHVNHVSTKTNGQPPIYIYTYIYMYIYIYIYIYIYSTLDRCRVVERLFRQFRDAAAMTGGHHPTVERLGCTGMNMQLRQRHHAGGGLDLRTESGKMLVQRGVPLKRRKKELSGMRGCGGFTTYRKELYETTPPTGDQTYKDWQREVGQAWKNLPENTKDKYAGDEREGAMRRRQEENNMPLPSEYRDEFDLGEYRLPVGQTQYETVVKEFMNTEFMPGLKTYCERMRGDFEDFLVADDRGDIDPTTSFDYTLPCPIAHPGVCEHDDAAVYDLVEPVTRLSSRIFFGGIHEFLGIS